MSENQTFPASEAAEKIEARYRAAAKAIHHSDGEVEIDDNADVSVDPDGTGGAYVAAWVWVNDWELSESRP